MAADLAIVNGAVLGAPEATAVAVGRPILAVGGAEVATGAETDRREGRARHARLRRRAHPPPERRPRVERGAPLPARDARRGPGGDPAPRGRPPGRAVGARARLAVRGVPGRRCPPPRSSTRSSRTDRRGWAASTGTRAGRTPWRCGWPASTATRPIRRPAWSSATPTAIRPARSRRAPRRSSTRSSRSPSEDEDRGLRPARDRRPPRDGDHRGAGRLARSGRARLLGPRPRRRRAGAPVPRRADHGAGADARRVARRASTRTRPRRSRCGVGANLDAGILKGFVDGVVDARTAADPRPVRGRHEHGPPGLDAREAGRVRRRGRPAWLAGGAARDRRSGRPDGARRVRAGGGRERPVGG